MKNNSKYYYIKIYAIALFYIAFLYSIYRHTGIVTINEAEKYIAASRDVWSGNLMSVFKQHLFYSSYIFFITPFIYFCGPVGVILAQSVMNFLAALCLSKTIKIINPSNKKTLIASLIFLFSYPLQFWTLTLFSDIFFVCIISITLYYTLKKKNSITTYLWILLLLVQTFSRPPGIFLTAIEVAYFLYHIKILSPKNSVLLACIMLATLITLLFYIPVETKGYIKPVASGTVIVMEQDYDIPYFNNKPKSTLKDAYCYLIENNGITGTIRLYFMKWRSFITLTRPYYSALNNMVLSCYYLLYLLSIIGLWAVWKQKSLILLFTSCVFALGNITALTYNEWHYRFTIATFPFLIISSTLGLNYIFSKFPSKSNSFTHVK